MADVPDTFSDTINGQSFVRTEHVTCPICGASRPSSLIQAQFGMTAAVAICPSCRLAYQSPRPSPEATLAYMNWRWGSSDQYVADEGAQLRRGREQLDLVRRHIPGSVSILDFGAGVGSFVRVARDAGWDAVGVERSNVARRTAQEKYGVELMENLPQKLFDVITLWDVIEHLRTPGDVLAQLRDYLRPGGIIFIETGNWECWLRLVNKEKWHVFLFDHQFYFSPASLGHILTMAGYQDISTLDVNRIRPPKLSALLSMPRYNLLSWLAWGRAKLMWPHHGDIETLVMTARPALSSNL